MTSTHWHSGLSCSFFTLENFDDRDLVIEELTADLLATAVLTTRQQLVSCPVLPTILSGLERVVVSGVVRSPSAQLDLVIKLATDLMTNWPPSCSAVSGCHVLLPHSCGS